MNAVDYRLVTEVRRHLLAIVDELERWRDAQPGVIAHRQTVRHDEPADAQPPRPPCD